MQVEPMMPALSPDRVRLPLAFDADRLRADLAVVDRDWIDHLVRQNYEGNWSVLPLRHVAGATHPVMMIYADPAATELVDGALLAQTPYFREVLAQFRCPLHTVRLMRLTPGSVIKPHRDHDLAAEWGAARIHIPITTNPDVEFLLNGTPLAMAPGEAWYLRLADEHAVANRGTTDRVHLVIDCIVDNWLAAMLREAPGARRTAGAGRTGPAVSCGRKNGAAGED
jgi:Aspartyl/Asparaginyl beta-hydroxylase